MDIKISTDKIVVLVRSGCTDTISIHTNLPPGYPPDVEHDNTTLRFEVQKGTGADYVRKYFGVEPEVLEVY